ncbi:MAG: sugar transferase [Christensenellaceae bacterium]|nr:sugar transferase [Christensenellaceae bacterium]
MNTKQLKGWLKHGDFILLDILCLQICFILSFWLIRGYGNPYGLSSYQYQAIILIVSQFAVILFTNNYSGILRRKRFDELVAVIRYIVWILVIAFFYLFLVKDSAEVSRLQFGFTAVFFIILGYCFRQLNKYRVFRSGISRNRSIVLITGKDYAEEALEKLNDPKIYKDYVVSGVILLDSDIPVEFEGTNVPVTSLGGEAMSELIHSWVDEAFILQPEDLPFPTQLVNDLMTMGITVDYSMTAISDDRWPVTDIRKLGKYRVLTSSIKFVSAGQLALKRGLDILGGLVGCIFTAILYCFVAPLIQIKSPGPAFFIQERIGKNGKPFKMHKFRTMYLDAEERKAELMTKNSVSGGMMFKMDDDPRIIGSEKKNKNGKPIGIGNILRSLSLDEFPQFFDILIGNMSLVGWRPCTLQEWEKYDLQHRIRASMKPGLTGMWQVSGRSQITDFDEVVRLDREYIENWSLWLDIKILLKTVWVVIVRKGAK